MQKPLFRTKVGKTVSPPRPIRSFQGFVALFGEFRDLAGSKSAAPRSTAICYAPDRVHFADGQNAINGALSNSAKIRNL